ncbi:anthranilate synthase component I family protein [Alienimonas chondri]|uniref:Aminodeoxychorismate synthase component 1 n=1 Tax=Alienimonas chondri TaxID=2681879 RepID=A0ABX1V9W9_9PLAN|nr:anthranilate synthase component I family protein [Alienimonas chondri]NNJ24682.1 Aminodeoxychorismate synthase component 1 [Alienimonas chondri]
MKAPLVQELTPPPTVPTALRQVADAAPVLLESVSRPGRLGRYSFLTADATDLPLGTGDEPFAPLRSLLDRNKAPAIAGLPPFQGGAVGLLGYEFGGHFERLPAPEAGEVWREIGIPPVASVLLADWLIAWDHDIGRAWAISTGITRNEAPSATRAQQRLDGALARLARPPQPAPEARRSSPWPASVGPEIAPGVRSPFTRAEYEAAVAETVELICAGDIFQANLSQPLLTTFDGSAVDLYERVRQANPAPFAGLFPLGGGGEGDDGGEGGDGGFDVVSASPERFLSVAVNPETGAAEVEARPIKGTRRRKASPTLDLWVGDELRQSGKDRAENVMIVDLLRNDLSRVCAPGSVRAPALCELERYETVAHLVSEVRGTLRPDEDRWSLLAAAFPCGSITGAPKVRAMEIIHDLEPAARGPYCGSLFWAGRDGSLDANVLIRTVTRHRATGRCVVPVGGGITARSDPAAEYEETLHKAAATLRAFDASSEPLS